MNGLFVFYLSTCDAIELIILSRLNIFICSIELPITLPRSMFERELDFYGINSTEGITDRESLFKIMDSLVAPVVEADKKLKAVKMERDMFLLALECNNQFCQSRPNAPGAGSASVTINKGHNLYKEWGYVQGDDRRVFDECLERYFGLEVAAGHTCNRDPSQFGSFQVCPKK